MNLPLTALGRPIKILSALVFVAFVLVLAPTSARAGVVTRFADPFPDSVADCSEEHPCDIRTAIDGATGGQAVRLNAGTYDVRGSGLVLDASNDLAPVDGANVFVDGSGLSGPTLTVDGGSSVSEVTVRSTEALAGAPALSLTDADSIADRVSAATLGPSAACEIQDGLLRSSLCVNLTPPPVGLDDAEPGPALSTAASGDDFLRPVLRGVTAYSRYDAGLILRGDDSSTIAANVRNSILRGQEDGAGASDVEAYGTGAVSADIDFSNFSTLSPIAGSDAVSLPGSRVNQTAEPKFVSFASADFREAPGSPTIDAGDKAAGQLGRTDRDGAKRVQGRQVDIGAYETAAPPLRMTIQAGPNKRTTRRNATFRFRARGGTRGYAYFCQLDGRRYFRCSSPRRYGNLGPGRHVFRVGVVDSSGASSRPTAYRWKVVRRGR